MVPRRASATESSASPSRDPNGGVTKRLDYTPRPMRRAASVLLACAFLLAACGGGEVVSPTPNTVEGETQQAAGGDPQKGKALFASQQCGGCHTFEPAGSRANVGPNLDQLEQLAKRANEGTLAEFTRNSIVQPSQYIERGYQNIMPPYADQLTTKEVNELVAFLTDGKTG